MKILLIIISLLSLSSSRPDHQDTPLEIDKNGNIIGLPEKYQPAKFDFDKRYLRINDSEITLPDCFEEFFANSNKKKINLSASWYHSKDILPYYLNIGIGQEKEDQEFTFLVALETLEFIELREVTRKENYISYPEVELDEQCLDDYKNNIKKIN